VQLIYGFLIAVMVLSLLRIAMSLRSVAKKPVEDWDSRFITQLRKAGVSAFEQHPIDFFFELPGEAACEQVATQLTADGFVVDRRDLDVDAVLAAAEGDFGRPARDAAAAAPAATGSRQYSLHARKSLRLIVPEIQALSKRFNELAIQHGGKYDGWAIGRQ
jgi:hypothetical protein